MVTRSLVGVGTLTEFTARYCHNDGYPHCVGETLLENWEKWDYDSIRLGQFLLSTRVGWSELADCDFDLEPSWHRSVPHPRWYDDRDGDDPYTQDNDLAGIDFLYLIDPKTDTLRSFAIDLYGSITPLEEHDAPKNLPKPAKWKAVALAAYEQQEEQQEEQARQEELPATKVNAKEFQEELVRLGIIDSLLDDDTQQELEIDGVVFDYVWERSNKRLVMRSPHGERYVGGYLTLRPFGDNDIAGIGRAVAKIQEWEAENRNSKTPSITVTADDPLYNLITALDAIIQSGSAY